MTRTHRSGVLEDNLHEGLNAQRPSDAKITKES